MLLCSLQVNHLSHALLALLLLPYISKAPEPRIVVVSSSNHFDVPGIAAAGDKKLLDGLNDPKKINPLVRYNETKCKIFPLLSE